MKRTLKEIFTDIIDDRDNGEITDAAAVQLCVKICEEYAQHLTPQPMNNTPEQIKEITIKDFEEAISENVTDVDEGEGFHKHEHRAAAQACYDLALRMRAKPEAPIDIDWRAIEQDFHQKFSYTKDFEKAPTVWDIFNWFKSRHELAQGQTGEAYKLGRLDGFIKGYEGDIAKPEAPIEIDWEAARDKLKHQSEILFPYPEMTAFNKGYALNESRRKIDNQRMEFVATAKLGFDLAIKSRPELAQGQTGEGMKAIDIDLFEAVQEVVRISDRNHIAWDKAKEFIKQYKSRPELAQGQNKTGHVFQNKLGKWQYTFTDANGLNQHSEQFETKELAEKELAQRQTGKGCKHDYYKSAGIKGMLVCSKCGNYKPEGA